MLSLGIKVHGSELIVMACIVQWASVRICGQMRRSLPPENLQAASTKHTQSIVQLKPASLV